MPRAGRSKASKDSIPLLVEQLSPYFDQIAEIAAKGLAWKPSATGPMQLRLRPARVVRPHALDQEVWLELDLGEWTAAYRLLSQQGAPVVSELRIYPRHELEAMVGTWPIDVGVVPTGGLPATLVKGLKVERPVLDLFAALERQRPDLLGGPLKQAGIRVSRKPRRRPGRLPIPDEDLAVLAADYVRGLPNKELARKYNKAPSTVVDWVTLARKRGLLTATKQGKRGGALTERAVALLRGYKAHTQGRRRK